MESSENRYAHLLQPIRELAKNWEIDVATELNDYLEELDNMCITFDGGQTKLNFAEAALLIQGSTCIYSKKVEMLHKLVFQTLDYMNDRNKKRNKQAGARDGDADGAADNDDGAEDEAMFTPLNVNVSSNADKANSKMPVKITPLPPESLVAPDPRDKRRLPLISVTGDVLCSQKDFRINLFFPADRDMVLLNPFCGDQYQEQWQCRGAPPLIGGEVPGDAAGDAGGDDAVENFLPLDDNGMDLDQNQDQMQDDGPEEHIERHQAPAEGRMIRERRPVETDKAAMTEEAPPTLNLWKLHDPYAVLSEDKPFKSGKCYKVPDGLDDGGKRKRKRACPLQDFRSWFSRIYDPPARKLKNGPSFTDLNYIYLTTMKNKLKTRKRICRRAGVVVSEEELRRTFLQPEEPQGEEPVDGFRHPGMLGDDENSDNEQEAFPADVPAEFAGGEDFIPPEDQENTLSYEDLVKLRVEQLVLSCRGYAQESDMFHRVRAWENMIRPGLAEQEQRPVFDIHDYGDRLVSSLHGVGQRRSFASIVHGLDNFEACKYLLASLQLANDYTVEIDSVEGLEGSVDSMGLTLLNTHRATDRFKTLSSSSSNQLPPSSS